MRGMLCEDVEMKTIEDRLNVVQSRLDERGLSDIKISFTPSVSGMSKEKLGCLVSVLLEDHLSGKSGNLALFGDSEIN